MDQVIKKCKRILREHYGRKFQGLLLYGSMARNQAGHDSDIDLLVLLNKPFDYFRELRLELRNVGDYGATAHVPKQDAKKAIKAAESFLRNIRKLLKI